MYQLLISICVIHPPNAFHEYINNLCTGEKIYRDIFKMEKNRYGLRWRANIRDEELMNKDKNFKELKGMDTRETLV